MVLSQCPRLWLAGRDPVLSPAQQHYLQRVRRLKVGDPILVVFQGQLWQTTWTGDVTLHLQHCLMPTPPSRFYLHLGIGIPKQGFDELLYTLTELGVARITPLITERTVARPDWGSQRWQRWQRICQEAAEQSEQLYLPQLDPPTPLQPWLKTLTDPPWVAVTRESLPHLSQLLSTRPRSPLLILTGPEGGWSDAERQDFQRQGGIPFSLGGGIFRAVTAPVVIASLVKAWWDCANSA